MLLSFSIANKCTAFAPSIKRRILLQPRFMASVTGTEYEAGVANAPVVKLFTKEGCTLCDKVKDVLVDVKEAHPHTLQRVDITDPEHTYWFSKYQYDIPGEQSLIETCTFYSS